MKVRRLLIVGASGVIGGALLAAARNAVVPTIGTARSRLRDDLVAFDMTAAPLRSIAPDLGPGDAVFLLAGYISPAWIFANPAAARHVNLDCSKRLVDEVEAAGGRLVFMSTDQVFDGEIGGYTEMSTPNPLNLYGRLKAEMEAHVLNASDGIVARTGWNVAWRQEQHCPVLQCYDTLLRSDARMAHDNMINVSDVADTARGLLALASVVPHSGKIYHLVSAPEISRTELAHRIKSESRWGAAMQFEAVPFASVTYSEPRPTRAFLRSQLLPDLGIVFTPPADVIRRKVDLIDGWRTKAGINLPGRDSTPSPANECFPKKPPSDSMSR